ncbi:hybrid sensor histidine kinase/response regulator [Chroococcidiopsis thermalis]|uniref:Circadian input-output histidine kinase CikA n=1 Tax=Chroococcidiopsis thermalis (strain PCC 7203) TaxID=251229 RepID=K9U450_CHRTP|nr:response regulator [Chroococcidiopsis thermalis]AFY89852.1 multi-sensor hybrid histidine kinase [Chroococcidiopsis thermalis PCC 7203]
MLRILLIDDNPSDRKLESRELQREFAEIEIQTAIDAAEFERALAAGGFDLVITDHQLHWSDGLAILDAVKTKYPDCPVILFTDSGTEEVAVTAMKRGATDYVRKGKPYRLALAVREALEKQNLRQERAKAIEQMQLSEANLRFALEAADLTAYTWNLQTGEVRRLENAGNISGIGDGEIVGTFEQVLNLVHPDDRELFQTEIQTALKIGTYSCEFRILKPDGSIAWVLDKGRAIYDRSGNPVGLFGIAWEITQRKQLEQEQARLFELEQVARNAAESANRIKDEFLAMLSHELRSPLNAILGWATILESGRRDETTLQRAISTILRNAQVQTQLIEDLLDVSRIVQGKLKLQFIPLNLATPIQAAIETVELSAQAKSIDLQIFLDCDPGFVYGDPNRLQQVVWNLLTNAIKFTPFGGRVEVRLSVAPESEKSTAGGTASPDFLVRANGLPPLTTNPTYAQITVSDTGKGIEPEFLPYVFELFRQADASTTRNYKGLGLGLAIVRYLVEMHGGSVAVESLGEGQGATFTVLLPLMGMESRELGNKQAEEQRSSYQVTSHKLQVTLNSEFQIPNSEFFPHPLPLTPLPLNNLRVLVVDDEPDSCEVIAMILQTRGAKTYTAGSVQAALQALEAFQPDLLVSDIGMPGEDGYALIRQLRTKTTAHRQIPAIAMTGFARLEDRTQAIAAGFQRHLPKPIDPDTLIAVVTDLIQEMGKTFNNW